MLSFPNRVHVASRADKSLRLATFERTPKLTLTMMRQIALDGDLGGPLAEVEAGLLLYLLTPDEFSRKNIEFASDFRLDVDPAHICWEIERRSVEPFHKFRYNLLPLSGSYSRNSLAVFAVSDELQLQLGELFKGSSLIPHRLVFKPVALHNALKDAVDEQYSVVIVGSPKRVDLLFYQKQKLVELRTLKYDLSVMSELIQFVDDVGTLAATLFSGVRLNQHLSLQIAGVSQAQVIEERFSLQLPYRIDAGRLPIARICDVAESCAAAAENSQLESNFDLAVVASAFTETEPCESLPVKNAASP